MHSWDVEPGEAFQIQKRLKEQLTLRFDLRDYIEAVAGADVAFCQDDGKVFATVVVLDFNSSEVIEIQSASAPLTFPYVPGLLSFREGPALLKAFDNLGCEPDVIIFDGQGIAHPRGCGLASHMGLLLNRPSIGCAKSKLVGDYEEPGVQRGCHSYLLSGEERIGAVLRTKDAVNPVFVSPGHLIDIESAVKIVLKCSSRYRLPEPTRLADIEVAKFKDRSLKGKEETEGEQLALKLQICLR